MEELPIEKLTSHFADVEAPHAENVSHQLKDIITLAICCFMRKSQHMA